LANRVGRGLEERSRAADAKAKADEKQLEEAQRE
jgi:hypothetical protein